MAILYQTILCVLLFVSSLCYIETSIKQKNQHSQWWSKFPMEFAAMVSTPIQQSNTFSLPFLQFHTSNWWLLSTKWYSVFYCCTGCVTLMGFNQAKNLSQDYLGQMPLKSGTSNKNGFTFYSAIPKHNSTFGFHNALLQYKCIPVP